MGDVVEKPSSYWHSKAAYAAMYFGYSGLSPYYSILFAAKGFSPSEIGWLASVEPAGNVLLLPPIAFAVDKFQVGTPVAVAAMFAAAVTALAMVTFEGKLIVGTLVVAHFIATRPIASLLDKHTMSLLPADEKIKWGTHRVFGAYGWGIGAPVASLLIEHFGWIPSVAQLAFGFAVACWAMIKTPAHGEPTQKRYRDVWLLLVNHPRVLLFLGTVLLMGMGYVFVATFLFLFLKDELMASSVLLGLSVTCTVLVEVPLFNCSEALHRRFTDKQLMTAAMIAWALRVTGYSLLTNPWYVLALEPLHGLTFGLSWLSGVHFFNSHFPADLSTSAFGVLHGTAFGLGPAFGNVLGGYLYATVGPRWMFRIAAATMIVFCALYLVVDGYIERRHHALGLSDDGPLEITAARHESPRCGAVEDPLPSPPRSAPKDE